jgi:outer membrane protein assembly factor BamB
MSASPLIVADSVIVLSGDPVPPVQGVPNHTVIAYHKSTGERVWSASTNKMAYASPMLVSLAGQEQLLVLASDRVLGLKPGDGSPLWSFPWAVQYDNNIAQPLLVASNRLVLSAGAGPCLASVPR